MPTDPRCQQDTYLNLIIFPQRHGSNSILGSELFRQWGGHQTASRMMKMLILIHGNHGRHTPDVRRGTKVSLAALGPVGGNVFVKFHFFKQGKLCNVSKFGNKTSFPPRNNKTPVFEETLLESCLTQMSEKDLVCLVRPFTLELSPLLYIVEQKH